MILKKCYHALYPTAPGDVRWGHGFWAKHFEILKLIPYFAWANRGEAKISVL